MTLVAAMIAPGILASGLLVADLAGYGERTRSGLADEAQPLITEPVGGVWSAGPGLAAEAPSGTRPFADADRAAQTTKALLDPTLVPEPYGPARRYEGLVRLPAVPAPVVGWVWKAAPRSAPEKEKRRPIKQPEPREERPACASEWKDTWLWDACREGGGQ
ncbi:hypothetical protein OG320_09300 [Microbispora sp. NBC_01189]|uniref:hypothetical protein n=1 Tax=Microbispora sp. NBC_01189 TaxID=2903583 RepID=UPI002E10800B|nr:hypothetical protein OG320_09300 [Microbispora sp. NBC_01189]